MNPAQTFANRLVDDAVVFCRRFCRHAAHETYGFHAGNISSAGRRCQHLRKAYLNRILGAGRKLKAGVKGPIIR
jgi:hypothetical protein